MVDGVWRACGREFTEHEVELIREVARSCGGLSRTEIAHTVCELLEWRRAGGGLKGRECLDLLAKLEAAEVVKLPVLRRTRPRGSPTRIVRTGLAEGKATLRASVKEVEPVVVVAVEGPAERKLFRELIDRYHYLGYRVPFGAHVQYLVQIGGKAAQVAGAVQFSSAAWRLAARERWIGWSERQREAGISRVVQNSRFLLLPWIEVKNLASRVLSLALRRVPGDWERRYAVRPLLAETLVDPARYAGTCYRAANWIEVGLSAGRGRMDREHRRHGAAPKRVFVHALAADWREKLLAG